MSDQSEDQPGTAGGADKLEEVPSDDRGIVSDDAPDAGDDAQEGDGEAPEQADDESAEPGPEPDQAA